MSDDTGGAAAPEDDFDDEFADDAAEVYRELLGRIGESNRPGARSSCSAIRTARPR